MKRVFGVVEVVFDICYLVAANIIGVILLSTGKAEHGAAACRRERLPFASQNRDRPS